MDQKVLLAEVEALRNRVAELNKKLKEQEAEISRLKMQASFGHLPTPFLPQSICKEGHL